MVIRQTTIALLFVALICACNVFQPKQNATADEASSTAEAQDSEYVHQMDDFEYVTEYTYSVARGGKKYPIVSAEVNRGKVYLTFDKSNIFEFGIVDEWRYGLDIDRLRVKGLKGQAKGVYIADAGEDINPILCVIMDGGQVGIVMLKETMVSENAELRIIPKSENIVAFSTKQTQRIVDGEKQVRRAIFATDRQGNSTELPLFIYLPNHLDRFYADSYVLWQWFLRPDWTFEVVAGWAESECSFRVYGNFAPIEENYEKQKFRYSFELTQLLDFTGYEYDPDPDAEEGTVTEFQTISHRGIFEIKVTDQGYMITLVKGDEEAIRLLGFKKEGHTIDYHLAEYWVEAFEAHMRSANS